MAYIPQPKDVTSFLGSSTSPGIYSNESMFRGPTLPSQQGFTGNAPQTPAINGPQAMQQPQPQMPQTQPQQSQWQMSPNIQSILQSIMGGMNHGMSNINRPMFTGMLR